MKIRMIGIVLCFALLSGSAYAVSFSGYLNDQGNTHLVGSGPDPSSPLFTDDWDISNNVALHEFAVASADTFTFESVGFGMGGIDPYFTLFRGTGPSATFVDSNYVHAFSIGGDFTMSLALTADTYTVAIGSFANMSFAENFGVPLTLGDGFVGLGEPFLLGNYYYELNVTGGATPPPAPEPVTLSLLAIGLVGLIGAKRRALN